MLCMLVSLGLLVFCETFDRKVNLNGVAASAIFDGDISNKWTTRFDLDFTGIR